MLFKTPEVFSYFYLCYFLIVLFVFRWFWRQKKLKQYSKTNKLIMGGISYKKRIIKSFLNFCVIALLIVAWARLQGLGDKIERSTKGLSVLLMVDLSRSMLVEDIKPNRLSFLKRELSRFLDKSWGDQVALGFFTRSAFLISPLTPDLSAVQSYLRDLSTDYSSNQGTDFKKVFTLAKDLFDSHPPGQEKILIIASDGESHSIETKKELKNLIQANNIRVFTLSVGTNKGGVIPIRDQKGQIKEYKKDSKNQLVVSRLQEESLKEFSRWGKGAYYHLSYNSSAIQQLREDLSLIEKRSLQNYEEFEKIEYYQWFLVMAMVFLVWELILTDRKKGRLA